MQRHVSPYSPKDGRNLRIKHQLAIEEKDAALALLSDDLQDHDARIQAIEYENIGLQGEVRAKEQEIERLILRYVPPYGKYDNILIGIRKNKPIEDDIRKSRHAFYMMRCQKRSKDTSIARLQKKYPDMTVLEPACEDPNGIHQWCLKKMYLVMKTIITTISR